MELFSFEIDGDNTLKNVVFNGDTSLINPLSDEIELVVPKNTAAISGGALDEVADIITRIVLPKSVERIDCDFDNCYGLEQIVVDSQNPVFGSVDGVLFAGDTLLRYPVGKKGDIYYVPPFVKNVAEAAFAQCCALVRVKDLGGADGIGAFAFKDCGLLVEADIPQNAKIIPEYAFSSAASLARADIPEGITKIGEGAFSDCVSLAYVSLPSTLLQIELNAFENCGKIKEVRFAGTRRAWNAVEIEDGNGRLTLAQTVYGR